MAFLYGVDLINSASKSVDERYFPLGSDFKEQVTIAKRQRVRIPCDEPQNVNGNNPITFRIPAQSGSSVDLSNSYFQLALRLTKQDTYAGGVLTFVSKESTLTTNILTPYLLFNSIKVKVNNKDVSDSSNGAYLYPYNTLFKKLLLEKKASNYYNS